MFEYDETFFKVLGEDALRSGRVVVSLLRRYLSIESVLDVGRQKPSLPNLQKWLEQIERSWSIRVT